MRTWLPRPPVAPVIRYLTVILVITEMKVEVFYDIQNVRTSTGIYSHRFVACITNYSVRDEVIDIKSAEK